MIRTLPARLRLMALVLAVALPAAGCNLLGDKDKDEYVEGSVEQLYNTGLDLLKKKEYKDAAKYFNEIDRQHPYSAWAARSQLMVAYANYKYTDYDTAILTLRRFQRLHPGHRDIAYAYYLEGLANFERVRDVKRDQANTRDAIRSFTIVSGRFPDSKYAVDATRKIAVLRDHLAGAEMEVGRYYQGKSLHLAAVNRFKNVVVNFQGSRHVPEALLRMTESYTALGLVNEARRTAAVLGHNFPESSWYADAYDVVQGRRSSRVRVPAPKKRVTPPAPKSVKTDAPPPPDTPPGPPPSKATDTKPSAPATAEPTKAEQPGEKELLEKTNAAKTDTTAPADKTTATKTEPAPAQRRSFFGRLVNSIF
ncbi:MAG: outer membrane protein assembly factor BamD [Bauldia litoralis]